MSLVDVARTWARRPRSGRPAYACDRWLEGAHDAYYRAVPVRAEPAGVLDSAFFPDTAITSEAVARSQTVTRLVMKIVARYPAGIRGTLQCWLLPWGDEVMARRQLLNLRDLAEGA